MGLLDKLKNATHTVTGGAARVSLEYSPSVALPGDTLTVRLTATSAGSQVKSGGAFVDLRAIETMCGPTVRVSSVDNPSNRSAYTSFEQQYPLAPAFTLAPNETKVFEGQVRVPSNVQPSFEGHFVQHEWAVRGRVEVTGNDPDSGFLALRVGTKG